MNFNDLKRLPPWEWPKDAGEIFLRVAMDKNGLEEDRLLAVELAGDCMVIDDAMALELLHLLRNRKEPEKFRAKAATSLGPILEYVEILDFEESEMAISKSMFDRIQEALRDLHEDVKVPREVRRRCLEASVRSPQDWHAETIRVTHLSREEDDRLTAIFCMGYIDGFQDELDKAMEDENSSIRSEALKALANWQEGEPWFDLDDPMDPDDPAEPGMEDLLLLSGMKVPGLSGKGNLWQKSLGGSYETNDEILNALFKTLTDVAVPWDDEFMDDDMDDEDDGQ